MQALLFFATVTKLCPQFSRSTEASAAGDQREFPRINDLRRSDFANEQCPRGENPTPAEKRAFERAAWFQGEQSGYFREHATRPQTIGYALADSAAGQALWIYEKFQAWTDNRGYPEDALSVDAMLDDISLYWFTNTAASSARI